MKKSKVTRTYRKKPDIDLKEKLDLNFLLDLDGWTNEEIKEFLLSVKKYKRSPHNMLLGDIFKRFFSHRTTLSCSQIIQEFTEAAKNGIRDHKDIEKYLNGPRKFRKDGKRELSEN